jgi:hypothetical protein
MRGAFGEGAVKRGRRRYSTCLSGSGRRRQAVSHGAEPNELAEALEAHGRRLFAGFSYLDLVRRLGTGGPFLPLHSRNKLGSLRAFVPSCSASQAPRRGSDASPANRRKVRARIGLHRSALRRVALGSNHAD